MSKPVAVTIREFDTRTESAQPESPLCFSYHRSGAPAPVGQSGVVLRERPFLGHIILRGEASQLAWALKEVLDLTLPVKPLQLICDTARGISIQWISPDEWLLIVPGGEEFTTENRLRTVLGAAHFAIVNVSGAQTLIELEGKDVRELLMKSMIYDVHPKNFPVGKGVTSIFAKTLINLRRPAENRWELILRRTFADYCYRWLLDAGNEYHIGVLYSA